MKRSPKDKVQRRQHLLVMGLSRYKWYESQAPSNVLARRLFPEGGQTQGGVPVRTPGPERGVDCENPTLVGEENETSYKDMETFSKQECFKAFSKHECFKASREAQKPKRKSPKSNICYRWVSHFHLLP